MTFSKLSQYDKSFQSKVLNALLTDKKFLLEIRDVLHPFYFDSDSHKWIISTILSYFDKYNETITMEVLKVELKKLDNDVLKTAIKEELRHSYEASVKDIEYIKKEFSDFCKNQELKEALLESADLLNVGDYEQIRYRIEKALKAGADKNVGHQYNKDIETRFRENYRPVIPTPWDPINERLQGGFGPGDLSIMFGSPGGGKSWFMVAIAAHAVKLGFNVIYYTLELSEDYVGKRFDAYYTGIDMEVVRNHRKEVEDAVAQLKGRLIIKEYPPMSASITTIKAHIQKCSDQDFTPNLVIIDYLDYLGSPSKKHKERKEEIDHVFIAAKSLAKELQIPILTPSQVNRAGAQDDVIEGDKVAGSYDKMMVADFCMSLSRKKEDKVMGTGRVHIMKNRYGMDGMTYDVEINTNTGHVNFDGQTMSPKKNDALDDLKKNFFTLEKRTA